MKDGFLYRVSLQVIPFVVMWLTRLLFLTCRIRIHGQEYKDQIDESKKPFIATFWHYTIFFVIHSMRKDSGVVMVSASKDGEYISRLAQKLGYETVRGSRKKGGMQAIKGLIRYMREGRNAGIVADGSQGPARVVQAGSIVLASRAAVPILPVLWSGNRYKRFGSWDGTILPYPFSRIDFFYGEPLTVPPKIKSEEVEKYRLILEERLNHLYVKTWELQGKSEH